MNHASPSSMRDVRKSRRRPAGAWITLGVWMLIAGLLAACASTPASVAPTTAPAAAPTSAPAAAPTTAPGAKPANLTVYAASSLTEAFTEIGREFERQHPGSKVEFNFGGSQQLVQQLAQGAPVDVFRQRQSDSNGRRREERSGRDGHGADICPQSADRDLPKRGQHATHLVARSGQAEPEAGACGEGGAGGAVRVGVPHQSRCGFRLWAAVSRGGAEECRFL